MPSSNTISAEAILIDLVHDLRQYLGNIETSVYCLGLLSDTAQPRTNGYLRTIEQQVACAENRLSEAGAAVVRLRNQRSDAVELLPLTKSATSVVT